jgi:hypothetical protein
MEIPLTHDPETVALAGDAQNNIPHSQALTATKYLSSTLLNVIWGVEYVADTVAEVCGVTSHRFCLSNREVRNVHGRFNQVQQGAGGDG